MNVTILIPEFTRILSRGDTISRIISDILNAFDNILSDTIHSGIVHVGKHLALNGAKVNKIGNTGKCRKRYREGDPSQSAQAETVCALTDQLGQGQALHHCMTNCCCGQGGTGMLLKNYRETSTLN